MCVYVYVDELNKVKKVFAIGSRNKFSFVYIPLQSEGLRVWLLLLLLLLLLILLLLLLLLFYGV